MMCNNFPYFSFRIFVGYNACMQNNYYDYENGIVAIDAEYIRPQMAAVHLVHSDDEAMIVDTGTSHSVPAIMSTLEAKGLELGQVKAVCLTHIHLDHAGGAGQLMQALPNAKLYVHPRGSRHMIDPSKLIAGTMAVYGEDMYKKLYKEILPIDAERVVEVQDVDVLSIGKRQFELIHTEGHARHHYCLVDKANGEAFTGDSFGVSYRETDTAKGPFIFPTSTPVHFDPEAAHATIERLMAYGLEYVYLTHYSQRSQLQDCADQLHDDLDQYVELTKQSAVKDNPQEHLEKTLYGYLFERLTKHAYRGDDKLAYEVIFPDVKLNAAGLLHWISTQ